MKLAVVDGMVCFERGDAEAVACHLVRALNRQGAEAELVRIPLKGRPPEDRPGERLIEEIALCRLLRLSNVDRMIGLRFPAYLMPHPDKVLWLLEPDREARDGTTGDPRWRTIRDAARRADQACLAAARRVFARHECSRERLRRACGIEAELLVPPADERGWPFIVDRLLS